MAKKGALDRIMSKEFWTPKITGAGVPYFTDDKAAKQQTDAVARTSRKIDAQVTNSDAGSAVSKMKSGMTSCQVTPGAWRTGDKIGGKMK